MCQVMTDCLPNHGVFGFKPGDVVLPARHFQAQKGSDGPSDMVDANIPRQTFPTPGPQQ